jgi:hypothetical protein
MSMLKTLVAALLTVCLAACAHYYKVTDPATGKVFYTEDVKRNGSAVEFKDGQTGGVTTLQNSEVVEIKKDAYQTAVAPAKK